MLTGTQTSVTVAAGWVKIFDWTTAGNRQVIAMEVGCNPSSAGTYIQVRVKPLHTDNDGFPVYKGGSQRFEIDNRIEEIWCKAVGGDCLIDWGTTKD